MWVKLWAELLLLTKKTTQSTENMHNRTCMAYVDAGKWKSSQQDHRIIGGNIMQKKHLHTQ